MAYNRELKYNAAGYKDPTAYHALISAEQPAFTPTALVYICSPYRGDTTANIRIARQFCAAAVERGYAPLALSVAARAGALWLAEGRQACMVCRPEANHHLEFRQA